MGKRGHGRVVVSGQHVGPWAGGWRMNAHDGHSQDKGRSLGWVAGLDSGQ